MQVGCSSTDPDRHHDSMEGARELDECIDADFPSEQWALCEQRNYDLATQSLREVLHPEFQQRWHEQSDTNRLQWLQRNSDDPNWVLSPPGNSYLTPLCASWTWQCTGDPFRYPESPGRNGSRFYQNEAVVEPVVFFDPDCARLSGHIWSPRNIRSKAPGVVLSIGSVGISETLYWWAAQSLVRNGYVVMTYAHRGQGRSDFLTPQGGAGSNANPSAFREGLIEAIQFFHTGPGRVSPAFEACAGDGRSADAFNPLFSSLDVERLGLISHSAGAGAALAVQSFGAPGAPIWPGVVHARNPVDVVVAWDGPRSVSPPTEDQEPGRGGSLPDTRFNYGVIVPHKPVLAQYSEYGLTPLPFTAPPDPDSGLPLFHHWVERGISVFEQSLRHSTHYEWGMLPTFPSSSWCPSPERQECDDSWGQSFAEHYMLAWLDRWLKNPTEQGAADADHRLLDDGGAQGRRKLSYYLTSARQFSTVGGVEEYCVDILRGCVD